MNFKGEEKIHTIPGAIISILLSIFLLYTAAQAIIAMLSFEEVTIENFTIEQNEKTMDEKSIYMTEQYFEIAIGFLPFVGFGDQVLIASDPRLVKIEIIMRSDENYSGNTKDEILALEACKENSFY